LAMYREWEDISQISPTLVDPLTPPPHLTAINGTAPT
jgi:hypothetical protein